MRQEIKGFKEPIQVTKSFLPPIEEFEKQIEKIWQSHWLTNNGPLHNELEEALKVYLKVQNAVLFTNGHLALDIAIKALKLTGEVITTPFTFASTSHAIVMNGLTPVFCDINRRDYTIDVSKIEGLITERTSAIIPVHVYGNPCDVKNIEKIAQKYGLKVIYDAAHVFGVELDGAGIGQFGDVSMFSLHATKVYNAIEGGVLTFNDEKLKREFQLYKNFGITGTESVEAVGMNAKMNEFQAAMGLVNLKYINEEIKKRKEIGETYKRELRQVEGIYMCEANLDIRHNYAYFPILIDEDKAKVTRNVLHEELKKYNIFTRKYFYPIIPEFECYKGRYDASDIGCARYVADRILTLPLYGSLGIEDAFKIATIIKRIVEDRKEK